MSEGGWGGLLDLIHDIGAHVNVSSNYMRWRRAFNHEGLLQQGRHAFPSCPAHGKVTSLQKTCAECSTFFSTNSNLEQHASSSGHNAFSCICGAQFSRAYTLTRHINSMIGPSFSCELCDDKAFPRLDKLGDHLRRWHRLGAKAFDQYKGGNSTPSSTPSPTGGTPPVQAEALGQAYPVAPGFEPMAKFNGFPSVSSTAPEAFSAGSIVSPDSSLVSESCNDGSRTTNSVS